MEFIEKKLLCETLQMTVNARFYIAEFDTGNNHKRKVIQYYECEEKVKCINDYNIIECSCFKEMRSVESKLC